MYCGKSGGKMATDKKTLVIVESPSKAKTIGKYLGSRYKVIASVGHVRDLPKSRMGIDVERDFEPDYISIRGKGEIIKELRKEAKGASAVYLATDPDREGEAISWHLAYLIGIDPSQPCRIEFHEITKNTIKEAIKHPRPINMGLVDAQQARRVLDRLVGYQISPLLWRKVRKGLSAGRVQSAALKIICDREREIQTFVPEEYWNISAVFRKGRKFTAKLASYKGKKIKIGNGEESAKVTEELKSGTFTVEGVTERERTRKPYAPFTTSSLQQDASIKLGFGTGRTMRVAQQLYEGVDIKGRGTTGLITYLRTDSVRISAEARASAASYIKERFGEEYSADNFFSNKKKDIQDAHEAIRPSVIELEPLSIEGSLTPDQFKLYRLIWNRFIASQMSAARFKSVQADISCGDYLLKASGSTLLFDGYQRVYNPGADEDKDRILPPLTKGEELKAEAIQSEQAFTQPPARYTEASLVKELEEKNIGRPSTYAPIVGTLADRKYTTKEKKALKPTELGFVVDDLMEKYFTDIVDSGFTAEMEDKLDEVELGRIRWKAVIRDFYEPFEKELAVADEAIEKVTLEDKPTGETCELCGKPMVLKSGRFGEFIACSGYPECRNTKPVVKKIDVKCPRCGRDIVIKKSRRGKVFYGCSGYPECQQSYWYRPVSEKCPKCGSLLVEKGGKKKGLSCSNSECDYVK